MSGQPAERTSRRTPRQTKQELGGPGGERRVCCAPVPQKLLRLYVNEQDRYGGKLLYEAIVDRCRELKIAGVTVFRALEGFGETAELHHSHLLQNDQPIVITIVESPEKASLTIPLLEEMMSSGVIAVTDVEVTYVSSHANPPGT